MLGMTEEHGLKPHLPELQDRLPDHTFKAEVIINPNGSLF